MEKTKIKVYTYTRVSTAMQIDGYSLDAQKSRLKAYADFNDYEIVREYEDAGKSGKSIEGRVQFNQMMDDIKSGKDDVSFVLVFKLSRFGRNAADVLSTLQTMQDFDVNLVCVEDGIDSSKDAGKLMISVLSAVAEIERENIRVQTMEGRIQKARVSHRMVISWWMESCRLMKKRQRQSALFSTSMYIRTLERMVLRNTWRTMGSGKSPGRMGRIPYLMRT